MGRFGVPVPYKQAQNRRTFVDSYTCTVCAYVYNPEDGDPDAEIDPGTDFDSLPEDWVCPVCGASKAEFEVVE